MNLNEHLAWEITKISLSFSSNVNVLYYFVFISINKNVLIDLVKDNNPELILFAMYLTDRKHETDDEITPSSCTVLLRPVSGEQPVKSWSPCSIS